MRRRIVFSLAAFLLAFALVALGYRHLSSAGNAGYVIVGLSDWVLETSLYFVIVVLVLLFLALYLGIRFLTGAARLPDSIKKRNTEQRVRKSVEALLSGLIDTVEGKWEKAERNLIRHAADSSLPLLNYLTAARAAHARGAPEQREDYLQRARNSAPQAELAVDLSRVKLLMGSHQFAEALECLNEINRKTANHPVALRLMCESYVQTRDWDALHHLIPVLREGKLFGEKELRGLEIRAYRSLLEKRALTRDPALIREIWRMVPDVVRSEADVAFPYCQGMIDAGVGDEVEEDVRLALGRDWQPRLLALYARIAGDAERQLASAEHWLGPHHEDPQLLQVLAILARRAGQADKAREYVLRSLAIRPTAEACQLMGDLLYEARDFVAAAGVYRQGMRLASGEPIDADALERAARILAPPAGESLDAGAT